MSNFLFQPSTISTDETSTENVLKSLQTFASVSGRVGLTTPRDAFITALCKASLPPHYTLTILNATSPGTVNNRGIILLTLFTL